MLKKVEKEAIVNNFSSAFNDTPSFLLINYAGSKVVEFELLRKEFSKFNTKISVVKNTLLQKATKNTDFEEHFSKLSGETAIALLDDNYVDIAKSFMKVKKDIPLFEIKFGYIDGNVVTIEELDSISKLPSREGLIGQFVSVLNQPLVKFLYAAKAVPSSLINVINNLKDQK